MPVQCHPLFPTTVATEQLALDPLDLAVKLQALLTLRGEATGNPSEGCAWTGDLNGVWQLHRHPEFEDLAGQVTAAAWCYLERLGFDRSRLALHLQRCWPVISDWDQSIGRHHHPNAHLSAVLYLSGSGSGDDGCLRLHAPSQLNELVPGLAVGHDGPLSPEGWRSQQVWDLAPVPGLLIFFPSRLEHSVTANTDPEALRCSISFDFVLTAPVDQPPPEYLAPHPQHWSSQQPPSA